MSKVIMAWSKCKIEIGSTGANDAMAETLTDIGVILNRSSSLESNEGEKLEMKATGGEVVASEQEEGTLQLKTTVIEPSDSLLSLLGIGTSSDGETTVTTHIVDGDWSVKVTPKNQGAKGIAAPKCTITYAPGWSEENGNQGVLTFNILKTTESEPNYWYKRFTTSSAL